MLTVQKVSKNFGGIKALWECSFEIGRGEITALIGPNGAGKTTLLDVVSGLLPPDGGAILLGQTNLVNLRPDQIAKAGVGRTFQQVRLFRNLTILDHLVIAETGELELKVYGLDKPLDTLVSDLSYGQRKLLQLAIAVAKPHQLLLLDEPVAGVNKVVSAKIEAMLLGLKKQGETILLIDHDMEFIKRIADKIVVMDAGKVLVEGEPEEALKDNRVLEAYLGE